MDIRKDLEARKKEDHISYDEYVEICGNHGLSKDKSDFLSQYYHNLGVIVHYQRDSLLRKIVVTNPDWVVDAVYSVLDTRRIEHNNGRFCDEDLASIWSDPKYKGNLPELLAIMKNYELCFELGNSKTYIAPELLSPNPPDFQPISKAGRLTFIYQYEFMPAGLLTRFIVKVHKLIEAETFWKHGVVISFEQSRASIIEDDRNRRIRIELEGDSKKELLAIIRREFYEIYDEFHQKMKYDELVPCNCAQCRNEEGEPHFFKWELLGKYLQNNKGDIVCENSVKEVNVQQLMGEICDEPNQWIPCAPNVRDEKVVRAPDVKDEEAASEVAASSKDKWWQTALIAGGAVCFIMLLLLLLPARWIKPRIAIASGVVVAGIVLLRNPRRRYIRIFWLVFSFFGGINLTPGVQLFLDFSDLQLQDNRILKILLDGPPLLMNIFLILLMMFLLFLDYKMEKRK